MEHTIKIEGRSIRLKANAATPFRYKKHFGSDFFRDLFRLSKSLSKAEKTKSINSLEYEDIEQMSLEITLQIMWIFAKEANPDISPFLDWIASFDSLPIGDITRACSPLIKGLL